MKEIRPGRAGVLPNEITASEVAARPRIVLAFRTLIVPGSTKLACFGIQKRVMCPFEDLANLTSILGDRMPRSGIWSELTGRSRLRGKFSA